MRSSPNLRQQQTPQSIKRTKQQPNSKGLGNKKISMSIQPAPNGSTMNQLKDQTFDALVSKSDVQVKDYMGVNQILVHQLWGTKPTYYVPAYLRMRVNRINQINYVQSIAQIGAELRMWLMIKDFPVVVQEEILNQAKMYINGQEAFQFSQIKEPSKLESSAIRNKSKLSAGFMFLSNLELDIESDPFWAPFQLIRMIANLQIRKITLGNGNPDFAKQLTQSEKDLYLHASVQFNFIDAHPFLQFSFTDVRHLGSFDIAQSFVDMKFSNQSIKDDEEQLVIYGNQDQEAQHMQHVERVLKLRKKIKLQKLKSGQITPDSFQHGQIIIPLYKFPATTIANIFIPLFTVAIINLGVFFQFNEMTGRNQNLAACLLAFIAFLPTIRENLPNTPKIVFAQILVYIQISCTLLQFFYSVYIYQTEDQHYKFVWNQTPAFLICVAITILIMITVISMMIIHKLVWERRYNTLPKGSVKYLNCKSMNTDDNEEWYNDECEKQFAFGFKAGVLRPFVCRKRKDRVRQNIFEEQQISELNDATNYHSRGQSLIYNSIKNNDTTR